MPGARTKQTGSHPSPPSLIRRIAPDGTMLPWTHEGGENEWEIQLEFEEIRGRLYPSGLILKAGIFSDGLPPGGITARLLRGIRIGQLVDDYNKEHEGNLAAQELFLGRNDRPTYQLPPPANRPRRQGREESFYQDVAVDYLQTLATEPRRPIAAMAPHYPGYTRNNVRDWVAKAREKGYLTQPGRGLAGAKATEKLLEALRARGASLSTKGRGKKRSPR